MNDVMQRDSSDARNEYIYMICTFELQGVCVVQYRGGQKEWRVFSLPFWGAYFLSFGPSLYDMYSIMYVLSTHMITYPVYIQCPPLKPLSDKPDFRL